MLNRFSLTLSFLVALVLSSSALASSPPAEAVRAQAFPPPPVRALAAVAMDASNGRVLAAVNPQKRLPMASTTKIMTALLALQLGNLSDRITVPKAAFNYESDATVMGLRPGEVVSLRDLLYGLLLPSGADAANTIAIHYAGSEAKFVGLMNRVAQRLGMRDTHYVDATGLSSTNHYTSAYDLALLGQYVSFLPDLMRITATRSYDWNGHILTNINHVLYWYPGVDGLKPGFTNEAGLCQLLDVRRDGRHIVVAILNTPDLVIDARNLLNFGLRDFTWIQSALTGDRPSITQTGSDGHGPYVYFPASGHYLRGAFRTAFQVDGGLATLGFPRTEALTEGKLQVQYFQNGALALDPTSGTIHRLALGSLTLEANRQVPRQAPSPKLMAVPHAGTATPGPARTPTPHPRLTPTPTPVPSSIPIAAVFATFHQRHTRWLGAAVGALQRVAGYQLQVFSYGALIAGPHSHTVLMLPIGDRFLYQRGFLAVHPGNAYPAGFASAGSIRAVGWLSS